jgi:hypothetical protein
MPRHKPPLTVAQILAWADAYHARAGTWPTARSGPIPEAPGEVWQRLNAALYNGYRGLPGGDSLARLLNWHQRGRRATPRQRRSQSWTGAEDMLVRTLPAREAAVRTGRTLQAVYQRRHVLGIGLPPDQQD